MEEETLCEVCDDTYANKSGLAKFRKKEHIIDGGTWWRLKRERCSA
jgi:hypothetical protein